MKKHRVIKAVSAIALSVSLILGGTVFSLFHRTKDYSNQDQIETIAKTIDCDLTAVKNNDLNKVVRMKHNAGEPIYVSISNEHTDEERAYINWSLDYVFDIVGDINDKYYYEIVDANTLSEKSNKGKTTISYQVGEANYQTKFGDDRANGIIVRENNKDSIFPEPSLRNTFKITYDREMHKNNSSQEIQYTFLHELLHAFGFDDVLTTTAHYSFIPKYCGNTVMNPTFGHKINCLTPNDYRCIISAYAPQMDDSKLTQFINEYKQKVSEYDETYYHSFSALCEYKNNITSTLDTSKPCSANYTRSLTLEDGSTIIEQIFVEVKDGKFYLAITDEHGNLLDQTLGDTVDCGNTLILKNVNLKKGLRPLTEQSNHTSYINDFILMRNEQGKLIFYDLAANDELIMRETTLQNSNEATERSFE